MLSDSEYFRANVGAMIVDEERRRARLGENTVLNDHAFHLRLVESAHNSVLVRILNSFYQLTLARRRLFFSNPARARESSLEHRRILDAIERRDAERAVVLVCGHMQRARLYWDTQLAASSGAA